MLNPPDLEANTKLGKIITSISFNRRKSGRCRSKKVFFPVEQITRFARRERERKLNLSIFVLLLIYIFL